MASSKVLTSSKPRNSDLSSTTSSRSRRATSSSATNTTAKPAYQSSDRLFQKESTMTVDGILRNVYASPSTESTLLDAQITLMESPDLLPHPQIETDDTDDQDMSDVIPQENKTADDIWREIVVGRKEMKDEPDEMMTLEDFLAKAGAVDVVGEDGDEVKMPPPERMSGGLCWISWKGRLLAFGDGMEVELVAGSGSGGGRGKRGRGVVMEPLDKAAQQRQKRMIKNRESAARSRERKQAYQVELESLAVRLEEENEQLLKAKDSLYNQLVCDLSFVVMEIVVSSYCILSLLIHYYLHPILGLTKPCELQIEKTETYVGDLLFSHVAKK
ncbi:CAMP-RESPONSE ELEMENT BINDING PROTEIN-RELATED [Salix koriyanagi]|uniref:cAMP-RESPONSE ELEMENT BINDING PROTEIN-RELATED n=1 Tax=Salix koriyanagi TaxID=2511006 RepID=A0A9Q0QLZ1_9ROSI|nr:CAMP-RESPONSE ELEMENT BINDING PROTEIN-RELATED [Salix koriyanagi]